MMMPPRLLHIVANRNRKASSRRNMQNETTGQVATGEAACAAAIIG
jgi:hypothetical protein